MSVKFDHNPFLRLHDVSMPFSLYYGKGHIARSGSYSTFSEAGVLSEPVESDTDKESLTFDDVS